MHCRLAQDKNTTLEYDVVSKAVSLKPFTGKSNQMWRRADHNTTGVIDLPGKPLLVLKNPEFLGCSYPYTDRR